jgi:threonine dehydratase
VIAGQGTCGLEIAEQAAERASPAPMFWSAAAAAALASGIALALEAEAPGLRVRPAEPEGFDDMARSLRSGRIERNPSFRARSATRS